MTARDYLELVPNPIVSWWYWNAGGIRRERYPLRWADQSGREGDPVLGFLLEEVQLGPEETRTGRKFRMAANETELLGARGEMIHDVRFWNSKTDEDRLLWTLKEIYG